MSHKILIIEDEDHAARRLIKMLKETQLELEVVAVIDSVEDAVKWLSEHVHPDLAFFDIQLADGMSFRILEQVSTKFPIIFTTAFDEFAIEAFHVNSIDYLLKPVKKVGLANALNKYITNISSQKLPNYSNLTETTRQSTSKRFIVRLGEQIKVINYHDVAYYYTENKINFARMPSGEKYVIDPSLDALDKLLDDRYYRINRQMILSFSSIDKMFAYSKSRVKLNLNPEFHELTVVSTDRSSKFKKWLTGQIE